MKSYQGFEAKKRTMEREILPAGNYVAKILNIQEQASADGKLFLLLNFDIVEGEHKDFFRKDYAGQDPAFGAPKWRGAYRLWEPTGDGSEQDEWTKRTFNHAVACFEESNPTYHWDWNEQLLKNKLIGVCFRDKEWEFNKKTGWTTECGALASANDVRKERVKLLKAKPLPAHVNAAPSAGRFTPVSDDDLPF